MRAAGTWLGWAAVATMFAALYLIFFVVPTEREMGIVQRIFYFHVPCWWVAYGGFFVVAVASAVYLWNGSPAADHVAVAAAEVGVLFCTLVLITGPIWARPVWGVWWTWDARLTLTLVLWLIYVGYLMLRHYVVGTEKRAVFSAVLGIVGFIDVPLVYFAIRWWRTQHPQPVVAGGEDAGLDPRMAATLWVSVAAFTLLFAYLYRLRARAFDLQDEADEIERRLEDVAVSSKGVR